MARTRSIVLSLRTKAKMIVGLFLVTKPDVHGERRSKLTDESTSVRSVTAHCADGLVVVGKRRSNLFFIRFSVDVVS